MELLLLVQYYYYMSYLVVCWHVEICICACMYMYIDELRWVIILLSHVFIFLEDLVGNQVKFLDTASLHLFLSLLFPGAEQPHTVP